MKSACIVLAVLTVAACKPAETVKPATPSAAPPPKAAGPAAITVEGWGPIKMGMTEAQALAALGENVVPATQPHDEDWRACHMINPLSPAGIWIMVEQDKVTRVTIEDLPVRSDRGIAVGDPAAKVRGLYPNGLLESPHKYEAAPAGYLTWYSRPGEGIRYTINGEGVVGSISGGTPSIEYVEGCA